MSGVKQQTTSAASCVSEQLPHCSPCPGRNLEKVVPKNACFHLPVGQAADLQGIPPFCSHNTKKIKKLQVATWNIRTLLDDDANPNRPNRRTALVAHELRRYNIDLAALSEIGLSGEDSLTEVGEGYTFFWRGYPQGERRLHGVGFAIKTSLLHYIPEAPVVYL